LFDISERGKIPLAAGGETNGRAHSLVQRASFKMADKSVLSIAMSKEIFKIFMYRSVPVCA
jgi:hypothetical protein